MSTATLNQTQNNSSRNKHASTLKTFEQMETRPSCSCTKTDVFTLLTNTCNSEAKIQRAQLNTLRWMKRLWNLICLKIKARSSYSYQECSCEPGPTGAGHQMHIVFQSEKANDFADRKNAFWWSGLIFDQSDYVSPHNNPNPDDLRTLTEKEHLLIFTTPQNRGTCTFGGFQWNYTNISWTKLILEREKDVEWYTSGIQKQKYLLTSQDICPGMTLNIPTFVVLWCF